MIPFFAPHQSRVGCFFLPHFSAASKAGLYPHRNFFIVFLADYVLHRATRSPCALRIRMAVTVSSFLTRPSFRLPAATKSGFSHVVSLADRALRRRNVLDIITHRLFSHPVLMQGPFVQLFLRCGQSHIRLLSVILNVTPCLMPRVSLWLFQCRQISPAQLTVPSTVQIKSLFPNRLFSFSGMLPQSPSGKPRASYLTPFGCHCCLPTRFSPPPPPLPRAHSLHKQFSVTACAAAACLTSLGPSRLPQSPKPECFLTRPP